MSSKNSPQDNTIEVVNTASVKMTFELDGARVTLRPGERTRVLRVHALPRTMQPGRDPVRPTIEMLTNGSVVAITHKNARPHLRPDEQEAAKAADARKREIKLRAERDAFDPIEGEV